NFDRSAKSLNDVVHIAKAQTKTLNVVNISCRNTVELIKNAAQLRFVHSHSIVFDRKIEIFFSRSGTNLDDRSALCVLDRIVQQVKYDVGKMKFIAQHDRILCFKPVINLYITLL